MLTKKHYIQLAAILKDFQLHHTAIMWGTQKNYWDIGFIERLTEWLAADNPNFDYARFMEAAGLK